MERKILVSPSLLAADFSNLEKEAKFIEECGADWLHYDVMDGHFVPNISFGFPVIASLTKKHNLFNDVHIMISDPMKYARKFALAGADLVTFHYEACKSTKEIFDVIDDIHSTGKKVGLSIKPFTPIDVVFPFLTSLDVVLIMSVEPGFGGQKFNPDALDKILALRTYLDKNKINHVLIQVDGGIDEYNGDRCTNCGADCLVAGTYLFGHEDAKERIAKLKKIK